MLDKLLISNTGAQNNNTLRGLLISTSVLMTSLLTFGLIFSLFSQNLAMGQDDLNISTLIAPPVIPDAVPPKPEPVKEPNDVTNQKAISKIATRAFNIQRVDDPRAIIPREMSTKPLKFRERPDGPVLINSKLGDSDAIGTSSRVCKKNCGTAPGISNASSTAAIEDEHVENAVKTIPKPPVMKPKPRAPVSGGVLNGKAIYLAQPLYSAAARATGASGQVVVNVVIDENGKVISATAKGGHPLLRPNAVQAARRSRFSPTTLSKVPVKVTGIIVYNFQK